MEYNLTNFYYEVLHKRYDLKTREEYDKFKVYVSKKLYNLIRTTIIYPTFTNLNIKIIIDKNRRNLEYGYIFKEQLIDDVDEFFEENN
jgi:hypothetical protein